jgi:hypothetical protein
MQRPEITGSIGPANPPSINRGEDRMVADVPAPHREEHSFCEHIHSLSAYCASFSREFRLVSGMAGMMLLVLGTYCSVSRYQMSAQVSQLILGIFLIVYAYTILVAVRCRGRHGNFTPVE